MRVPLPERRQPDSLAMSLHVRVVSHHRMKHCTLNPDLPAMPPQAQASQAPPPQRRPPERLDTQSAVIPAGCLYHCDAHELLFTDESCYSSHLGLNFGHLGTATAIGTRSSPVIIILNLRVTRVGSHQSIILVMFNIFHLQVSLFQKIRTYLETLLTSIP
jgi:hypothetical protein